MDIKTAFGFGLAGGLIGELFRINVLRHADPDNFPKYVKRAWYWILGVCWVLAGGFLAGVHAFDGTKLTAFICVNIGLTAPLFVEAAARTAPPGKPGSVS